MDPKEARALLSSHLAEYRKRSYAELCELQSAPSETVVTASSGLRYGILIGAFWDNLEPGNLRVTGEIAELTTWGGRWPFMPICADFIIAPDGSFVGEHAQDGIDPQKA